MFRAAVPSGASTGIYEALEMRDKDPKAYHGKGMDQWIKCISSGLAVIKYKTKNSKNYSPRPPPPPTVIWEPWDVYLHFVNSAIRTSIFRPPLIRRPHLRTEPGTLMGLSLESRLMFCRCDARGQQCEQSDRTSSYRKGGSLKCSLFIVQIRHENENKSAEARIERCNIVLLKIPLKQVITRPYLIF